MAATLVALALCSAAPTASAYTTRIHIALSNEIHDALVASGDGTVQLRLSPYSVKLPDEDAAAILAYPKAFRAGAIGPDNMVFPGMTDMSHALGLDPYRQCELLYAEAFTQRERAYALGCFLHGSSDAVAHHFVNYFAGETFTLTPLETSRVSGYINMVRHIITESMIQEGLYEHDPALLGAAAMSHTIVKDFVLRAYFDTGSALWKTMSKHAVAKLDAYRAANPSATLAEALQALDLGPAEYLVMLPLYVKELHAMRLEIRPFIEGEITTMQADTELGVTAGTDGVLGTPDDSTDCTATCPNKASKYFAYVNMLAPRVDADGDVLPPAVEKITDKLGDDLDRFMPAYVDTIALLSAQLNAGVTAKGSGFDMSTALLNSVMAPLNNWVDRATTIDYNSIKVAVLPSWLITFTEGLGLDVTWIIRDIFKPYTDAVRAVIRDYVIAEARTFLNGYLVAYETDRDAVIAYNTSLLNTAAAPDLGGNTLDFITDSGLWGYSFNMVAVTLGNHEVMLSTDEVTTGPASFDASYTLSWSQAGQCDYLAPAVFPLGMDVSALLTVSTDKVYPATAAGDAPVECHAGSLSAFGTPSMSTCAVTTLDDLIAGPGYTGSLSRAYPPEFSSGSPACRNLTVPGLPTPTAAGTAPRPAAADDGDRVTAGTGCSAAGAEGHGGAAVLLFLMVILMSRRARRGALIAALAGVMSLSAVACGGGGSGGGDGGSDTTDAGVGTPDASGDSPDGSGGTPDAGPDYSGVLLGALGNSVWTATQVRDERYGSVTRLYELHIDASSLRWVETRNPFGPARLRTMRSFHVHRDGITVDTVVKSPEGWPPHPDNGDREVWKLKVIDGSPRTLQITDASSVVWELTEGPAAAPTTGLTATVRAFATGVDSPYQAFCDNISFGGTSTDSDPDRRIVWDFARGLTDVQLLGEDRAAGVSLGTWDGEPWSITDVLGFRPQDGGGTQLSDTANFTVHYQGTLDFAGGELGVREIDDHVEDAFWVFLAGKVGSTNAADLFMEVHNYAWANRTDCAPFPSNVDECFGTFGAGGLPVEIIVVRCTETLEDEMLLQMKIAGGPWTAVESLSFSPVVNDTLFPPSGL